MHGILTLHNNACAGGVEVRISQCMITWAECIIRIKLILFNNVLDLCSSLIFVISNIFNWFLMHHDPIICEGYNSCNAGLQVRQKYLWVDLMKLILATGMRNI